jgi:hypothetical protein
MSGSYTADQFYKDELARLEAKQGQVSRLSSSQQRLTLLNDSYRKRYAKYVQILMVLVLAYIVYLGMTLLQKSVPGIPVIVFDIGIVLLIFLVVYYLFFAFATLYSRNNTNYDELDIPSLEDGSGVDAAGLDSGKLAPNTLVGEVCVGESCCPDGYDWNQTENKCVVGCGSGKYWNPVTNICATGSRTGSVTTLTDTFTTLEYASLNQQGTRFDDPSLKRSPDGGNVQTTFVETGLNFSKV